MTVDVFQSLDGTEGAVIPRERTLKERQTILGDKPHRLVKTITGSDWDDCMRQYNEFMGYAPYIPMP